MSSASFVPTTAGPAVRQERTDNKFITGLVVMLVTVIVVLAAFRLFY